ncbi:MAG: aspartate kinase, partial [Bacteroidetes bacterium]|nr:aspartate kinase [Bacteroidota bacterium]
MQPKVFKFGGASVKDAEAVRNVVRILGLYRDQPLLVVVSAMGKTTNALEKLVNACFFGDHSFEAIFKETIDFHKEIISMLFPDKSHEVYRDFAALAESLQSAVGS